MQSNIIASGTTATTLTKNQYADSIYEELKARGFEITVKEFAERYKGTDKTTVREAIKRYVRG